MTTSRLVRIEECVHINPLHVVSVVPVPMLSGRRCVLTMSCAYAKGLGGAFSDEEIRQILEGGL